ERGREQVRGALTIRRHPRRGTTPTPANLDQKPSGTQPRPATIREPRNRAVGTQPRPAPPRRRQDAPTGNSGPPVYMARVFAVSPRNASANCANLTLGCAVLPILASVSPVVWM